MSDQREFKVGDQVTIIKSGAKMYIRGYRGKHQVAISSSMDCEVAGVFDVSEITAGHRIDEPFDTHREKVESVFKNGAKLTDHEIDLEVVVKQPENTLKPLLSMDTGVVVNMSCDCTNISRMVTGGCEHCSPAFAGRVAAYRAFKELFNKSNIDSNYPEIPDSSNKQDSFAVEKVVDREAFEIRHDIDNQQQFIDFMKTDGVAFHFENGEPVLDFRQGRSVGLVVAHKWNTWNYCMSMLKARHAEVDQLKNELLAQDKRMMRTFALVKQWRDEAVSPRLGFEPDITGTLESCADELEKAIGGGV